MVGWMLSVTTTLVCASMAVVIWLVVHGQAGNDLAMLLVRYLHFSSIVTALISLGLLVAVLKLRREPPPQSIVAAAVRKAACWLSVGKLGEPPPKLARANSVSQIGRW